jgi:hypothetical protein
LIAAQALTLLFPAASVATTQYFMFTEAVTSGTVHRTECGLE